MLMRSNFVLNATESAWVVLTQAQIFTRKRTDTHNTTQHKTADKKQKTNKHKIEEQIKTHKD